jgi:hypothetical protein
VTCLTSSFCDMISHMATCRCYFCALPFLHITVRSLHSLLLLRPGTCQPVWRCAGPWKGLFIACGFDPRLSLDGRPYQMLAYRLPTEW